MNRYKTITEPPDYMDFRDGVSEEVEYLYDADGRRLRKTQKVDWRPTPRSTIHLSSERTDYCGPYLLRNGVVSAFRFDGGYCSMEGGSPAACHFYLRDSQGNIRMVVNAETDSVEQVTHYYPYGRVMADISTGQDLQPCKYGGKELDRFGGLDLYDFHARQMDPLLPSFTTPDPNAEDYYGISPYAYCAGDPVNRVDPDGKDYWSTNDPDEIEKFFLMYRGKGLQSVNTSNWHHTTDADFLANLAYNDHTNKYYYSYCSVENGEVVCNGMSFGGLGINAFSNVNTAFNSLGKSLKDNAGNSTLGNNGKFYWRGSGERGFYGNQYVKTAKLANIGCGIIRVTGPVGLFLSVNELYNGYQLDGGKVQTVGYNTVRATASVAGGWAGGMAGLKTGAAIGFGIGYVPGSIIGGTIGGFIGTMGGSWFGTNYIDYLYGK